MQTEIYRLNQFGMKFASQGGEDGIIQKILEVIETKNNWCVEFGSWDGMYLSNTYNLICNHNYSAVLIEGNKKRFKDLVKNFRSNPNIIPMNTFVGFNNDDCLDIILEKTPIPLDFDVLSIDIDGNDYHIWDAVKKYKPKIVVVEFNPTVPQDVEFIQPKDMNITQGSGILSTVKLANSKGYELAAIESANAIFVKKEFYQLLNIIDNSIDVLWQDKTQITKIFFGFDGTVFLRGLKIHPWQSFPIDENKMQLIPKWARKRFGGQSYLLKKAAKIYRKFKKVKKVI